MLRHCRCGRFLPRDAKLRKGQRRLKCARCREVDRNYRAARQISWKHPAREALAQALRTGSLVRPETCSRCGGARGDIQAHHADYFLPVCIIWLCQRCHGDEHAAEFYRMHLIWLSERCRGDEHAARFYGMKGAEKHLERTLKRIAAAEARGVSRARKQRGG